MRRCARAEELLALFALSDKRDIKTKEFSKGMKLKEGWNIGNSFSTNLRVLL
jgi:ABC-type multidrug transport system ATPase subunit